MEKQSAKALETILKLEQQNNEIQREYEWLKNELDESQMRTKQELERNVDLVNANRELEDYIKRKEESAHEARSGIEVSFDNNSFLLWETKRNSPQFSE